MAAADVMRSGGCDYNSGRPVLPTDKWFHDGSVLLLVGLDVVEDWVYWVLGYVGMIRLVGEYIDYTY